MEYYIPKLVWVSHTQVYGQIKDWMEWSLR